MYREITNLSLASKIERKNNMLNRVDNNECFNSDYSIDTSNFSIDSSMGDIQVKLDINESETILTMEEEEIGWCHDVLPDDLDYLDL